jgi:hypothetical protein
MRFVVLNLAPCTFTGCCHIIPLKGLQPYEVLIKQHDHAGDKRPLKCTVLLNKTMPQMSQVLKECEIGMLTAGMSTPSVAREFNVKF